MARRTKPNTTRKNQAHSDVAKLRAVSPSEYSHKVEDVVVRYRNGHAVAIVYPPHLSGFACEPPKSVNRGGAPSVENAVRYVLNRAISNYIFTFDKPKRTPVHLTRYGLTTLAMKWVKREEEKIDKSSTPTWDKDKMRRRNKVSKDSINRFVKRFFKRPGQRLSPEDLRRIFPDLWYT